MNEWCENGKLLMYVPTSVGSSVRGTQGGLYEHHSEGQSMTHFRTGVYPTLA